MMTSIRTWMATGFAAALVCALLVSLTGGTAFAATESADINAVVGTAITLAKNEDLNFGTFVPHSEARELKITFVGTQEEVGVTTDLVLLGGSQAAQFTVGGQIDATYSISFPQATATLSGPEGAEMMTVKEFGHNANELLDGSGEETFSVGATLEVGANQTAGTYAGSFSVEVAYD